MASSVELIYLRMVGAVVSRANYHQVCRNMPKLTPMQVATVIERYRPHLYQSALIHSSYLNEGFGIVRGKNSWIRGWVSTSGPDGETIVDAITAKVVFNSKEIESLVK